MAMSLAHQQWNTPLAQSRIYYPSQALPAAPQPPSPVIPEKNKVELNREMLIQVLEYFSNVVPLYFDNRPVRLVIHGGACMLLHPQLYAVTQSPPMSQSLFVGDDGMPIPIPAKRTATRDVDYINRSFTAEWKKQGVVDATERLKKCIRTTARQFGLGADWMNSDADIALPMATNSQTGAVYDPIYTDSLRPNNVHLHTIFTSRNQQLTLISVTPFWAVALKLVRYSKWDPGDICALLRNGTLMSRVTWTAEILEGWLHKECWPMGYASYDAAKVMEMRKRIQHAVTMVNAWNTSDPPSSSSAQPPSSLPPPPSASSAPNTPSSFVPPPSASRFAPEAWSMGGQGTAPAPPPGGAAWSMSPPPPGSSGQPPPSWGATATIPHPSPGHWSAPSTIGHKASPRDSWIGGWAVPVQSTGNSHVPVQTVFTGMQRPAQEENVIAGSAQNSSLGLTLGREAASWSQSRPEDRDRPPNANEPYSQSRLARPRHWESGTQEADNWRASVTQETIGLGSSSLQGSQSLPVIPRFDNGDRADHSRGLSASTRGRPDENSVTASSTIPADASSSSFSLPPGFVYQDTDSGSPWDWYGLTEEQKEMVIAERRRRVTAASPYLAGEYSHQREPQPQPVIPREDLLQKTPPTNYLYADDGARDRERRLRRPSVDNININNNHRPSMSLSGSSQTQAWHPDSAERGARAREKEMSRLMTSSMSVVTERPIVPDDDDLWRPYHGRGTAADANLRHSMSLGVL